MSGDKKDVRLGWPELAEEAGLPGPGGFMAGPSGWNVGAYKDSSVGASFRVGDEVALEHIGRYFSHRSERAIVSAVSAAGTVTVEVNGRTLSVRRNSRQYRVSASTHEDRIRWWRDDIDRRIRHLAKDDAYRLALLPLLIAIDPDLPTIPVR